MLVRRHDVFDLCDIRGWWGNTRVGTRKKECPSRVLNSLCQRVWHQCYKITVEICKELLKFLTSWNSSDLLLSFVFPWVCALCEHVGCYQSSSLLWIAWIGFRLRTLIWSSRMRSRHTLHTKLSATSHRIQVCDFYHFCLLLWWNIEHVRWW